MKQIKDLINPENPTMPRSSKCSETVLPMKTKLLDSIFAVMTAVYGQKWTSLLIDEQMIDDMQKVWGHHLRDADEASVKTALQKMPSEYPDWPPTVGQFLALCKVGRDPDMQPKLPKPRGDETIALESLEEIKRLLRRCEK